MALLNIFDIAGSALTAQSQRLNVAASNLANADSVTGPDGQPYRAKQVVFQVNAAPGAATGGVKVADVIESQAPDKLVSTVRGGRVSSRPRFSLTLPASSFPPRAMGIAATT